MGLFGNLFGGTKGQVMMHAPLHRMSTEMTLMDQIMGQYLADNPQMAQQFFSTGEGQKMMERLGITDPSQLQGISGMPSIGEYENLDQAIMGELGGIDPNIGQAYDPYQFSLKDISQTPDQVYDQYQKMQEEAALRGAHDAGSALEGILGSRGVGRGGLANAGASSLGRQLLQQYSDIGRTTGLQRAQERSANDKFLAQLDLNRQMQQAGENRWGAQYNANRDQSARDFRLNRALRMGDFGYGSLGQRQQRSMLPYQMQSDYFYRLQPMQSQGYKKSGILSNIAGSIGDVAGAAGSIGGMFG